MMNLWMSVVGSHAWGLEKPDSDLDVIVVYQATRREILLSRIPRAKVVDKMPVDEFEKQFCPLSQLGVSCRPESVDVTKWEIGMLVGQLKKGNLNALWAVLTPLVNAIEREVFSPLWALISSNPRPSRTWPSVKGIAYNSRRTGATKKKLEMIMRVLYQFEAYMKTGKMFFEWDMRPFDIEERISDIDEFMIHGITNQTEPDIEAMLDDYLVSVREHEGRVPPLQFTFDCEFRVGHTTADQRFLGIGYCKKEDCLVSIEDCNTCKSRNDDLILFVRNNADGGRYRDGGGEERVKDIVDSIKKMNALEKPTSILLAIVSEKIEGLIEIDPGLTIEAALGCLLYKEQDLKKYDWENNLVELGDKVLKRRENKSKFHN